MTMHYIVRDEKILGGTPVIVGTRIPVERVIYLRNSGYTEDKVSKELSISPVKVRGAVNELATIGFESFVGA